MSSTLYENSASLQELLNTVNDLPVNRELTAESITNALGYTPADQVAVEAVTMITDSLVMEVSAIPSNYVSSDELSSHNTSNASHNDIRLLISELTTEKADKDYLITMFEELKTALEESNLDAAIAVLDKAILDFSALA